MSLRLAGLLALLLSGPAFAEPDLAGRWRTEDGTGVIEIATCGATLCGRIIGMSSVHDANGEVVRDVRGTPMCGLTILRDAEPAANAHYAARITDPTDGSTWHCTLWLDEAGNLNLRGYVLLPLFGQTQVWTRFGGRVDGACGMAG